ncbi:hypothetical protein [Xenorhabdus szentirmaii]|uniref:Uncharacterized protein n=1 Tax=Xenorhabdus szentirmaii DSM 16338 TaxID=1427518 RepID=W1J4Y5_9GAMM|nr:MULTISPECIES: hypothetical protein [Xenorhabdus]MBD2780599.1 hypothetical protein [Xenorhabdus sp. 38]PHM32924.1 hypothetical protein Xsze_03676 [Xenorhabdus szentirmaii DSM 16338]CDL85123.1 conserved hypothetical protein [Xenorhabdus szentirmaii DSM 16338]
MDILFELFLPKEINIESLGLKEVFVEWAGERYSQEPKKFQWNDSLIFEEYKDTAGYHNIIGNDIILEESRCYTLQGNALNQFQALICEERDLANHGICLFFNEFIAKITNWIILILIDYDQFDKIYNINDINEAFYLLERSLHPENIEGIALVKK